MGLGKTYSTSYLADSNNNTGAAGQVLISTATGINWSDANTIGNGPYLPLSAGSSYPLTDNLFIRGDDKGLVVQNAASTTNVTVGAVSSSAVSTGLITLRHLGVTKIVLNANDNSYFTGNVGIGTTSPETNLMIYDTVDEDPAEPGFATTGMFSLNTAGQATLSMGVGANNAFWMSNVNRAFTGPNYYNILLNPLGGKVGIGTSNPDAKLDVEGGDIKVTYNSGYNLQLSDSGGTGKIFANGDSSSLVFGATVALGSTATERMRIVGTTGNVGIGITNPSSKLELWEESTTAPTLITLHTYSADTTSNGTQGSFIDFKKTDDNASFTPQARIGMLIKDSNGDLGIPSEGCGNLVFHTSRGTDAVGAGEDVERMRITDIGNVGIGTTSPGEKLEVSGGNILVKSSNNGGGATNNNLILFDTDTTASAGQGIGSVQFYGSDASGAGAGVKSEVKVFYANDGDSSIMTFSTSDSVTNNQERIRINANGDVGIGTDSPGYKLQVQGSVALDVMPTHESEGIVRIGRYDSNTSRYNDIKSYVSSTAANSYLKFSVHGGVENATVDVMTLNGSGNAIFTGNVGIGNSDTSGARLKVLGKVVFDGHNSGDPDTISRTAYPADQMFTHYDNNGVSIIGGKGAYAGVGLTIGEETSRSSDFKFIRGVSDTNGGANAAEEFWVDGIGGAYFAGNVGIGTAAPLDLLALHNSASGAVDAQMNFTTAATGQASADGFRVGWNGAVAQMYLFEDADMRFATNNAEKMRITSTGNVGIGLTVPTADLQIASVNNGMTNGLNTNQLKLSYGASVVGAGSSVAFGVSANNNFTGAKIVHERTASNSVGDLTFWTRETGGAATDYDLTIERMRIDSVGNVGIGTDSPSARLHVEKDSTSEPLALFKTTTGDASVRIEGAGGESYVEIANTSVSGSTTNSWGIGMNDNTSLSFGWGTNSTLNKSTYLTMLNGGNVGIGTTDPQAKLDIVDTDSTTASAIKTLVLGSGTSTTGNGQYIQFRSSSNATLGSEIAGTRTGSGARSNLMFSTTDSTSVVRQRMVIDSAGNVGIGTTTPYGKLDVAGDIRLQSGNNIHFGGTGSIPIWITGVDNTTNNNFVIGGVSYYSGDRDILLTPVNNGNVGIKNTAPSYTLDVTGTIRATGDVIAYSDARVKDNVITIDNALDKVIKLRGVSYTRNDVEDKTTKIGVIAQEVLEVIPEVVQQDDEGKYSVAYGNMVGLLIESIKELKAEMDLLKSKSCNCNKCNCNI